MRSQLEVMEVLDPNSLLVDDMPDTSMFYSPDDFPSLPDFPCMSSSSSSSFTRAPVKATSSSSATSSPTLSTSSSSSSAASWAVLRSDKEADRSPQLPQLLPRLSGSLSSSTSMDVVVPDQQFHHQENGNEDIPNSGGVDECLDVMETFGYMDMLECNDLFDPASIFNTNDTTQNSLEEFQPCQEQTFQERTESQEQYQLQNPASATQEQFEAIPAVINGGEDGVGQIQEVTDEMGEVFLEWLRTNRESISAEDLRRIKIKKSTIESAARRLGGGKAAMKQLLKLILEWVQTSHLQRKRKEAEAASNLQFTPYLEAPAPPPFFPNPNPAFLGPGSFSEPNSCYPPQPWIAPSQVPFDQSAPLMAAQNNSFVAYMGAGDPFSSGGGGGDLYPPSEFHMLDSTPTWQVPQQMATQPHYNFVTEPAMQTPAAQAGLCGYGNNGMYGEYQQTFYSNSNNAVSQAPMTRFGSSATKEARKKRMARQRRLLSHHRGGGSHHGHISSAANQMGGHQNMQMGTDQQHARLGGCNIAPPNWMYWPAQAAAQPQLTTPEAMTQVHNVAVERSPASTAMQGQSCQRQGQQDRRQVPPLLFLL